MDYRTGTSFESLTSQEFERHLARSRYGNFELTDAVRPSPTRVNSPMEGYQFDEYIDRETNTHVPIIMAAVSRERLYEVFMDLTCIMGDTVDVVVETSHAQKMAGGQQHTDHYREGMDTPVLQSMLWDDDIKDLLLNDGCTGIALVRPDIDAELQFDEHKLFICYNRLDIPFEDVLREHRIPLRSQMRFITGAEHIHSTRDKHAMLVRKLIDTVAGCPVDNYGPEDDDWRYSLT